jgi:hypothetical protein
MFDMNVPEFTCSVNAKVTPKTRETVEDIATKQGISLGEATRYLLEMGLERSVAISDGAMRQ